MARPVDPLARYRVKLNVCNGHTYASTQPPTVNLETGRKEYHRVNWGSVDENLKFTPNLNFIVASPEERGRLIFPENWDMSEARKYAGLLEPGRPVCDYACQNRMYGDIWLLEQVAAKTGVRQDLEAVFDGNIEMVDDIMTLAMFPYLTKCAFNRVARWQDNNRAPSTRELTPSVITRLTQSITERHRMDLLHLRAMMVENRELCAVDSTSRSAYGGGLADTRWGKDKDRPPLAQTTEVVVYTLSTYMPLYYMSFSENIPDLRTLDAILEDLDHSGFKNLVTITDRGYDSLRNLEKFILRNQAMIMRTKTTQKDVAKVIEELGKFSDSPDSMDFDHNGKYFFKQIPIDYEIKDTGNKTKSTHNLNLNLYFDSIRRAQELVDIRVEIGKQNKALNEMQTEQIPLSDDAQIRKDYYYYKIKYDSVSRLILHYQLDEKKVAKAKKYSGFFSIFTNNLDFDAIKVLETYRLRDEQEKYFQQMKDQMASDLQQIWSEEEKTGRLFILFVSLILGSYVHHVWKSTTLRKIFSSSLEVLDEMRSIRYIEHTNGAKMITPFVGKQVDICRAFGFEIPKGCAPLYESGQKIQRKRGRPPKARGELSL
jgi:hypothetical protein